MYKTTKLSLPSKKNYYKSNPRKNNSMEGNMGKDMLIFTQQMRMSGYIFNMQCFLVDGAVYCMSEVLVLLALFFACN